MRPVPIAPSRQGTIVDSRYETIVDSRYEMIVIRVPMSNGLRIFARMFRGHPVPGPASFPQQSASGTPD